MSPLRFRQLAIQVFCFSGDNHAQNTLLAGSHDNTVRYGICPVERHHIRPDRYRLVKETGSDIKMSQWNSSRIGFKGTEDLGGGYQATFQLEQRYFVNNGAINGTDWKARPMSGCQVPSVPSGSDVSTNWKPKVSAGLTHSTKKVSPVFVKHPALQPGQQHHPLRFTGLPELFRQGQLHARYQYQP